MEGTYQAEANRFFRETDEEIDPDAAMFIKFFEDEAFWLCFGNELKNLQFRVGVEDHTARPLMDRYLHGLICADRHLGMDGKVIQAMVNVLSHTPEVGQELLCLPSQNLAKCLEGDAGPHSRFSSSRLVGHIWSVFGDDAPSVLEALCGRLSDDLTPLVISAALDLPSQREWLRSHSDEALRQGLSLKILMAVQIAAQPGMSPPTAHEVFSDIVNENLRRDAYLTWPEWQLLPLLSGGIEYAKMYGIDLTEVSKDDPVGGKDASIWSAAFLVNHAASSDELYRYYCDVLLPTGDPVEIMPKVWSMGSAMGKWAIDYIEQNREVFFATKPPSQWGLDALIRHGVSKRTVMSHPDFTNQAKGKILSDDLGL